MVVDDDQFGPRAALATCADHRLHRLVEVVPLVEQWDDDSDLGVERLPRRRFGDLDMIGVTVFDQADRGLDRARELQLGDVGRLQIAGRLAQAVGVRLRRSGVRLARSANRPGARVVARAPASQGRIGEGCLQQPVLRQAGARQLVCGIGHCGTALSNWCDSAIHPRSGCQTSPNTCSDWRALAPRSRSFTSGTAWSRLPAEFSMPRVSIERWTTFAR